MSCCEGDGEVTTVTPKASKTDGSLDVTPEAASYIAQLLKKDGKENWGLKIEVAPGGCAGFKYSMSFQEKAAADEKVFEFHGVKVFMSLMSFSMLKGSTVEFVNSLEATGLKVNNPNMTRTCGCGKSFG